MEEQGLDKIQKLVERFKSNLEAYKSKGYKEYELRKILLGGV